MPDEFRNEFREYLRSIELSAPLQERVETIYQNFSPLFPENVGDIFVTDLIDGEGIRRHENLWFLTEKYLMETKNFPSSDNIDFILHSGNIVYVELQNQEFNLVEFNNNSRMTVSIVFTDERSGIFRSTQNNCPVLLDITKRYFLTGLNRNLEA